MAKSGNTTINVTSDGYIKLRYSWSAGTPNIANNFTPVNWTLQLISSNSSANINSSAAKDYSVTTDGTPKTDTNTICLGGGSTKTLTSGSKNIYHSADGTTFSLLAQYNLGTNYRQSINNSYVTFAGTNGWEYSPGPKEIDIQTWSTNPKTYVNAYVEYLKEELEADSVAVDLITLKELQTLGCIIPSDYGHVSSSSARTCTNSPYKTWLVTDQYWWTRSAGSISFGIVWLVYANGDLYYGWYSNREGGVRPVITISKDTLATFN